MDAAGERADLDDGSAIFAEVGGEIVSGVIIHSAEEGLNADGRSHAAFGATPLPGLAIGMEEHLEDDPLFDNDLNDIVLSVERLAVELA
ncbi:hypothetical protein DR046_12910 [Jannaschia formosa]|nr:hypothetical protein DR046_12910 [Jannaschia formosa]